MIDLPIWKSEDETLSELEQHARGTESAWSQLVAGKIGSHVHDKTAASIKLGEGGYIDRLQQQKSEQAARAERMTDEFVKISDGSTGGDSGTAPAAA